MAELQTLIVAMRARAGTLRGLGYRVRFALTDTAGSILLDGTGSAMTIAIDDGAGDEATDTVLYLSSGDLEKLIAGRLSPMLAYSSGRLRVEGSKGVAMKLASMLDEA